LWAGELRVELPERPGEQPMFERDARKPLVTAAELLAAPNLRAVHCIVCTRFSGKRP
jgi:hypothetical protein